MTRSSGDFIAAATLIVGFGVTVFMFRVQREITVQEQHPEWPSWLAWSDYLILASITLALFGAVLPLLIIRGVTRITEALAAATCIAAVVLQAGYVPAILAHYRIAIGTKRTGPREEGEPAERRIVTCAAVLASIAFGVAFWQHWAG